MSYEYQLRTYLLNDLEKMINVKASQGWRVHSITPRSFAQPNDFMVLFEREEKSK